MLDTIICLLSLSILITHVWSLQKHFDTDVRQMPKGMNRLSLLVAVSTLLFVFLTYRQVQPLGAQLIGLAILLGSFALFWAAIRESSKARLLAAFDEKPPTSLLRSGPYFYVRHPFYTSYLMLWSGWAIATWSIWAVPSLVAIFTVYGFAARDEESKFAETAMAGDYAAYAAGTGRFFPKPLALKARLLSGK